MHKATKNGKKNFDYKDKEKDQFELLTKRSQEACRTTYQVETAKNKWLTEADVKKILIEALESKEEITPTQMMRDIWHAEQVLLKDKR